MSYYTYAHFTADTKELFYIGKGHYRKDRPQATRAASSKGRNKYWNNIVKKHGGFTYEVLAEWKTEKEALDHEMFLIPLFKEMNIRLCNLTNGGEGLSGWHHTEEHKKKMSELQKGNTYCKGKKLSKERVDALSKLHKGVPKTKEHREKLSKARTGIKVPSTWKQIHCITTNVVYPSLTEAALDTGCDPSHIVKCCKGKLKQTKKKEFEYVSS
jgi:hypothetical protein